MSCFIGLGGSCTDVSAQSHAELIESNMSQFWG